MPHNHSARTAAALRVLARLLMVGTGLSIIGCQKDNRISVEQLRQLETSQQAKPVSVKHSDLALAEVTRYRAQPGDTLKLTMIGLTEGVEPLSIPVRVDPQGKIRLPLVGLLPVAGKDLGEIERIVVTAYVPDYKKDLTAFAEVEKASTITVVVIGAAGQRGLVSLPSNKRNLLYALVKAEGFIQTASGVVHVRSAHGDRELATYDLNDANDLRRAMRAPPLESGDMITVEPGEVAAIYVTGLVNTPGPIVVDPGVHMSVMQVISAGNGLIDQLEPKEATLWRKLKNGARVRVRLALDDIQAGRAEDVELRAGDILDIPPTLATRFRKWFFENIEIGPFGVSSVFDPVADRRAKILRNDNSNVFRDILLGTVSTSIPTLIANPAVVAP